jgi:hypothetical protein
MRWQLASWIAALSVQTHRRNSEMTDLLLPRLYERDIDVLLQEELIFNDAVNSILSDALKLDRSFRVQKCRLSVVHETGETDLFAVFSLGSRSGVLLVENKIDAAFQPRQPERYRERAVSLASGVEFDRVYCVLVAPCGYFCTEAAGFAHFDAIVSYEDIAAAMEKEATPRSKHRAALLLRAMRQAQTAYTMVPVLEVGDLWDRVYQIAKVEFPELKMNPPGEKGAQSKWIIFKADLPPRVTIDWKITKATIDLSFWKGAKNTPTQSIDLSPLPSGATLGRLGDTTAISVPLSRPPSEWTQMANGEIRAGLGAAVQLLQYYRCNLAQNAEAQ